MTRDDAIILAPIIKAWSEGKRIECKSRIDEDGWYELMGPLSFDPKYQWRIKPEPELVPFDYEDNLIGKIIVEKDIKRKFMVIFQDEHGIIYIDLHFGEINVSYAELLTCYTFIDGTNCGKKVE